MTRKLKFWWFRRQNGYPCKEEFRPILVKSKISTMSRTYLIGMSYVRWESTLESVAEEFGVTRERVRQVLNKIYRGEQ